MFSSTAQSKNPFVRESYLWPSFCQNLKEKRFLVPNSDDTIIPPNGEHLFKMCQAIKEDLYFSELVKQGLYLFFLVPLYILRNKAFLTQAFTNFKEECFYLNGAKDKESSIFRTNHGFSFCITFYDNTFDIVRDHSKLEDHAKRFNDYCKKIIEQNKIRLFLVKAFLPKISTQGPWWHLRIPAFIRNDILEQIKQEIAISQQKKVIHQLCF